MISEVSALRVKCDWVGLTVKNDPADKEVGRVLAYSFNVGEGGINDRFARGQAVLLFEVQMPGGGAPVRMPLRELIPLLYEDGKTPEWPADGGSEGADEPILDVEYAGLAIRKKDVTYRVKNILLGQSESRWSGRIMFVAEPIKSNADETAEPKPKPRLLRDFKGDFVEHLEGESLELFQGYREELAARLAAEMLAASPRRNASPSPAAARQKAMEAAGSGSTSKNGSTPKSASKTAKKSAGATSAAKRKAAKAADTAAAAAAASAKKNKKKPQPSAAAAAASSKGGKGSGNSRSFLGRRVRKHFKQGWFEGTVVALSSDLFYKVIYDDTDTEECVWLSYYSCCQCCDVAGYVLVLVLVVCWAAHPPTTTTTAATGLHSEHRAGRERERERAGREIKRKTERAEGAEGDREEE